jgi:acetyl-CoA carboxylase biotin carboxyl carrier protein
LTGGNLHFLGAKTIVPLDAKELREILLTLNQTDISEMTLKQGDFELVIRRGTAPAAIVAGSAGPNILPMAAAVNAELIVMPSTSAPLVEKKYVEVNSPIVGTFYGAPGPDEPAFAQIGNRITKGQTVCIIEAMKIMNEIEAEVTGEVVEILVQNGQPVEYGQILMRVNPS